MKAITIQFTSIIGHIFKYNRIYSLGQGLILSTGPKKADSKVYLKQHAPMNQAIGK